MFVRVHQWMRVVGAFALISFGTSAFAQTVPVNIESTPAGATVHVDDEATPALGVTPLRRVRVPRGAHVLIFKKESHQTARLNVNVSRRNETFRATLAVMGVISASAGNDSATGAELRIDGESAGPLPARREVQPGRHLIQVGRAGYVTFSQWVEISGNQVLSLPVTLTAEAPSTGAILIASDVNGATVFIDGQLRGNTPTIVEGLPQGDHAIEVRPVDTTMNTHRQSVRVVAGERLVVNATLRPAPPTGGSLRVLVNAPGAVVYLDGEALGNAPAESPSVTPGEHIVEARADGYVAAQRTVTVEEGRARVLSIELAQVQAAPGRIVVNTNTAGAVVTIDGSERGPAPVVIEAGPAGTHAILVRAPGYREFRHTCETAAGVNCEVNATLQVEGTPVRVTVNVTGAHLYVDDELLGPVPFEGEIPAGSHRIEVRREGYRSFLAQQVFTPASEVRLMEVVLVEEGEMTPEERAEAATERLHEHEQAVARSGVPLPDDLALLDFSIGWPYLFEGRLGIGILDWLEAGVALRTFVRLTEFEARVKAGWRPVQQFSLGAQFRVGGGLGPTFDPQQPNETAMAETHPTNTFFTSLEGLLSLHFLRAGNFTLWAAFDFHSDRWDWNGKDDNCLFEAGCMNDDNHTPIMVDGGMNPQISGRQNAARFRLGGSLEFILSRRWNAWGSFEGVFGPPRRVLGDIFGAGNEDLQMYFRLGLTYKFDVASEQE